jgi:hypothetical protein
MRELLKARKDVSRMEKQEVWEVEEIEEGKD